MIVNTEVSGKLKIQSSEFESVNGGNVFGGAYGTVIADFDSIGVCILARAKHYKFMLSASDMNVFFFPKANLIITIL